MACIFYTSRSKIELAYQQTLYYHYAQYGHLKTCWNASIRANAHGAIWARQANIKLFSILPDLNRFIGMTDLALVYAKAIPSL